MSLSLHVAFEVELEQVHRSPRRLAALGITPLSFFGHRTDEPTVIGWMPAASVFFRDPDGHLLEYLAVLDERPRADLGIIPWSKWVPRAVGRRQASSRPKLKATFNEAMDNLTMSESLSQPPLPALPSSNPAPDRYEPIHPGSGRRGFRKRLAGVVAAIAALLAKAKALIFLLPKLKLITTFGSMLVSIAAYSLLFGLPFAAGFVLLLLLHELGHVIQLRREGIKASAPMFIPFLGAVISAKSMGKDAAAEARVGLAGPVLGTIASLVPLAIWLLTGSDFWRALAYIGFVLNLFNLLPVVPLDGGRAMAALSPTVWLVGLAGLVALAIFYPSPIVFLILVFGGLESWRRWKARGTPEGRSYYTIAARTRLLVGTSYLGLAALLSIGVAETFFSRGL